MEKLNFSTSINAPKEKVWDILWNDITYRAWTSAFTEGSSAKTDNWKEGTKVLFLDHKGSGMVSMVAANRPNEYMSFKHLGEVKEGMEDTTSEKVKTWAGALENYTLKEANGKTELLIEMSAAGMSDEFKDYFLKTFPIALENIKQLSEGTKKVRITVTTVVNVPVEKVWKCWTEPQHIMQWNHASDDWHCPKAENNLKKGGNFSYTMAAKDGSFSFDFVGVYDNVIQNELIENTLGDGRKMKVAFTAIDKKTKVVEIFEAESENSVELQKGGWQAILDNFKKHTESN